VSDFVFCRSATLTIKEIDLTLTYDVTIIVYLPSSVRSCYGRALLVYPRPDHSCTHHGTFHPVEIKL
jgi:hypothetical protein